MAEHYREVPVAAWPANPDDASPRPVSLSADTDVIGKVGIDQTTPGTTNGVQVVAALPAGTALIGKTGIDQTTPGTTNGVQINAALPAGAALIGKTGIDQTTSGTTNKVSEATGYANLSASAQVKASAGALLGIFVASASASPTIKVWAQTTAAVPVLVNTFTPVAATFYPMPANFAAGLYVTIGGTVDLTVFYD